MVDFDKLKTEHYHDPYVEKTYHEYILFEGDRNKFIQEIQSFLRDPRKDWGVSTFVKRILSPMYHVWILRSNKDMAIEHCQFIWAQDWREACERWLERRKK